MVASGAAHAQTPQPSWIMPEILAAAKAEGQVTVYSSTNEQEALPLWKLYEDATGIKVNYVRGAESPLHSKIAIEARTGQQSWDVHNAGTVNMIPPNLALQFDPPNAKDIMPEARDGRDKGLKLLRDIQATLKPVVLDGHFAMARQIAAGEYPIALMNYSMLTTNLKQQGAPTDYVVLDPVHLWFGMVGVNKNAPHPKAALLAANFLLSREAQDFASKNGGRVPTRLDVESNPKDLRQRMAEKKIIFEQHTAEQSKVSQKLFDEIFKPR